MKETFENTIEIKKNFKNTIYFKELTAIEMNALSNEWRWVLADRREIPMKMSPCGREIPVKRGIPMKMSPCRREIPMKMSPCRSKRDPNEDGPIGWSRLELEHWSN